MNASVSCFIQLAKLQAIMSRRFDARLGGLGLNEFIILFHLSQAEGETLRRVDLAERVGLTASGVTRLLLPMEKIGLVKRVADESDARVSQVKLAPSGRRQFEEGIERAEILCEDLFPPAQIKKLESLSEALSELARSAAISS